MEFEYEATITEPDDGGPAELDLDTIDWSFRNCKILLDADEVILTGQYQHRANQLKITAADGADPTLVVPEGFNDYIVNFTGVGQNSRAEITGIDIDIRKENTTAGLRVHADSYLIEDVEYIGRGIHSDSAVKPCINIATKHPDGSGTVRNVTARKGSSWARYKNGDGRQWAWIGHNHLGTVRIKDCHAEEFGNNGIYGSSAPGRIIVDNCEFWNNNAASLRFASKGSVIKNTTVGIDTERYTGPREPEFESRSFFHRAIWQEAKTAATGKAGPLTIDNCEVIVRDPDDVIPETGKMGIYIRRNSPGTRIRDADVDMQVHGAPGIIAHTPGDIPGARHEEPSGAKDIQIMGTTCISHGGKTAAVHVSGRDLTVGDGCCIEACQDEGTGVHVRGEVVDDQAEKIEGEDGTGTHVRDATLSLGDSTIVASRTCVPEDADLSSVTTEGGCTFGEPEPDSPKTGIDVPGKGDGPSQSPQPIPGYFRDPMKLKLTNEGDGRIDYQLIPAEGTTITPGEAPRGDEVNDDGTVDGQVWPDSSDSYVIDGPLSDVNVSGPGAGGLVPFVDGYRTSMLRLEMLTRYLVVEQAADAVASEADALSADLAEMREDLF